MKTEYPIEAALETAIASIARHLAQTSELFRPATSFTVINVTICYIKPLGVNHL